MLLNAGMSVRKALFYNLVSSVLSLFGMILGVLIGNVETASTWIFGLTAGIFIYISLVDMVIIIPCTFSWQGGEINAHEDTILYTLTSLLSLNTSMEMCVSKRYSRLCGIQRHRD